MTVKFDYHIILTNILTFLVNIAFWCILNIENVIMLEFPINSIRSAVSSSIHAKRAECAIFWIIGEYALDATSRYTVLPRQEYMKPCLVHGLQC